VTSNLCYTTRDEKERLSAIQPALGRAGAGRAALIPLKKARCGGTWRRTNAAGSSKTSRATRLSICVISPRSRAGCIIPVISGKPFDFITWFDYAPEHERDFDALLAELRASEEWTYVEREIDIRLVQAG
jgi:hypothetical protein